MLFFCLSTLPLCCMPLQLCFYYRSFYYLTVCMPVLYRVVQKSRASAYFCLHLLNASIRSNNFWHAYTAVFVEYCTAWYLFIFTRGRDYNETTDLLFTYKFIYPTTLICLSSYFIFISLLKINKLFGSLFIHEHICILMLLKYRS